MATADEIIEELQTGEYDHHPVLEEYLQHAEEYDSQVFQNLSEACTAGTLDLYPNRGGSFCQYLWDYGPYAALLRAHPKNREILEEMGYTKRDEEFDKGAVLNRIFEDKAS